MVKFKKYLVYLEDSQNVYRCAIPATNKKDAANYCGGNGEVFRVKEVDTFISLDRVSTALKRECFNDEEIDFVLRTLQRTGIAE